MLPNIPSELSKEFEKHLILADIVFGDYSMSEKTEAMEKARRQSVFFKSFFASCGDEEKREIQEYVLNADMPLLNMTDFATKTGFVFSCQFSPYISPGSFSTTKRLSVLSKMVGTPVGWHVIAANVRDRFDIDKTYDFFFGTQQIVDKREIDINVYRDMLSQAAWSKAASVKSTKHGGVDFIFSRSQPAVSHLPALECKKAHPDAKWIAEFGDMVSTSAQNEPRYYLQSEFGEASYSDNFFINTELAVYEHADTLVFPTENMYDIVCSNCSSGMGREMLERKKMILPHTGINPLFCGVVKSTYEFDPESINVSYFGIIFFVERDLSGFFDLARNKNIKLHIFAAKDNSPKDKGSSKYIDIHTILKSHKDAGVRVVPNNGVGNLEHLNIAKRSDYLYVEDIEWSDPINPFLPSKVADYLSTGTKIIAKVQSGSALDKMEHPNLIKTERVTPEFAMSLTKQKQNERG
jgi:hypothetical protein